ncbi:hypothetical protein AR158_c786R [Paramecium bursaria Chlorella virus AR158]|uniref:hypothetical protein n=1 Tax=Paramecium bursaria Chlorella virus AR158 TaxID=380598 RepID=UPI00015AA8FD|nr:hypothetical protein AR158_c786R [Paramecium bursaria Chlorella virus AR158]ABU44331.1 hypothetical protein AR158_c786R [Paramecium bursaria Chlorella virus AR158]
MILRNMSNVITNWSRCPGFLDISLSEGGVAVRATAAIESMTRLTYRSWTTFKGVSPLANAAVDTTMRAIILIAT